MRDYFIGGINGVREALQQGQARELWLERGKASNQRLQQLKELAERNGIVVELREGHQLDLSLPGVKHQGALARCVATGNRPRSWEEAIRGRPNPLLLILDHLQDPHNLGACLRSAAAAGVDAVLLPQNRAAAINDTVRKVACGATEMLNIFTVTNLRREMAAMKEQGLWLVGAAGEAEEDIYDVPLAGPLALILGNEGDGLGAQLRRDCDYLARIPLDPAMESLNVSVACGICLFEVRRQRR